MKYLPVLVLVTMSTMSSLPGLAQTNSASYSKHVQPFFNKYCSECHNARRARGGLSLADFQALREGSDEGPVLVAGNPDKSRLVLVTEGKAKPVMPPKESKVRPTAEEIARLRNWVKAGAKFDKVAAKIVLPDIRVKRSTPIPISSLVAVPKSDRIVAGSLQTCLVKQGRNEQWLFTKMANVRGKITSMAVTAKGSVLAMADSVSGSASDIILVRMPEFKKHWKRPSRIKEAHDDTILQLAFSPDGKKLISVGYDRKVKIWDTKSLQLLTTLSEHSDSVCSVAFRPDGKVFATAGADRAVKVWRTWDAKLLYTLSESTDWVYSVAWSPDGKHVAAGGVDKSIRIWRADEQGGTVVHSVFAHSGPIVQLLYSRDGNRLFSLSEDRTLKSWDTAKMIELAVSPKMADVPLSMCLDSDQESIWVGRFDGTIMRINAKTGNTLGQTTVGSRVKQSVPEKSSRLTQPPTGTRASQLVSFESGKTPEEANRFSEVEESESNNSAREGQWIEPQQTILGVLERAGDVDYFRFRAKKGQQLGVAFTAKSKKGTPAIEPDLVIMDDKGNVLANDSGFLGITFSEAGVYSLGIRDRDYRGSSGMKYELKVGKIPVITSVYPLGVPAGKKTSVRLRGVFLGKETLSIDARKHRPGETISINVATPFGRALGAFRVAVSGTREVVETRTPSMITVPTVANGRISEPGERDLWRFRGEKGQRIILEVTADRLGSKLDSMIEILDAERKPLARATLRPVAKTYVAFRDHNNAQSGIRIEAWSELAINDYIYVGTQLLKIRDLPTHPDSDCQFFTDRGQRQGFLGTTPAFVSKGEVMYKVTVHPPGTKFPPNGFPVITLYHRNDDANGLGRDSRIVFDPPQSGVYYLRIRDTLDRGGENFGYRVSFRSPEPNFRVSLSPSSPKVWRGGAIPLTINATRIDEYDGPIDVKFQGFPEGMTAPNTTILAGENSTTVALKATDTAKTTNKIASFKVIAEATMNGKVVRKVISGGKPSVVGLKDIKTWTREREITLSPGGKTKLTVSIQRLNGFRRRVPIKVNGLPHGVKVLDIGLNGILITEKETRRTMVLYCEPWVRPTDRPIVVSAQREGTNTQHAADSVMLRIVKK
ncbi:MAG: WD40 repeat domain-containing protein [Gemmataceae bacterium]